MINTYPGIILAASGLSAFATAAHFCRTSAGVVEALLVLGLAAAALCAHVGRLHAHRQQ